MIVGLISDTHGLLRPAAVDALRGSDLIVHAGDIGDAAIITALRALAPVVAVRGNNDVDAWAGDVAERELVMLGAQQLLLLHDVKALRTETLAPAIRVVVSGHSHRPHIETRDGVLYVNPGSAGPRRFQLPISLARLRVDGERIDAELLTLG